MPEVPGDEYRPSFDLAVELPAPPKPPFRYCRDEDDVDTESYDGVIDDELVLLGGSGGVLS